MSNINKPIEIKPNYFPKEMIEEFGKSERLPDDFTFYVKKKDGGILFNKEELKNIEEKSQQKLVSINLCGEVVEGRAIACLTYGDKALSITFRLLSSIKKAANLVGMEYSRIKVWKTGFSPRIDRENNNLNSLKELCELLYKELFIDFSSNKGEYQGIIVITGATASAKSQITRGLIDSYLKSLVEFDEKGYPYVNKRRPHLVTFEDPIEKYFQEWKTNDADKSFYNPTQNFNIDYTPREKNKGVKNLNQALEDALRQTPKVFFVGETRVEDDWLKLLKFAGTGHLVFTTAHAGSLIETMQMIFKATKVKSASERNHISSRILGIVHIKRLKIDDTNVLLPSLWRKTPQAINNITATGLSSMLPSGRGDNKNSSMLGRTYFAKELFQIAQKAWKDPIEKGNTKHLTTKEWEDFKNKLIKKAIEFDLRGD